jgi:DNA-binding NarL/FixJ family response regulator
MTTTMRATNPSTLSVLLVEDSIPIRYRLVALFCESPQVRIVGEAGTIDEARFLIRRTKPEAVVLDVELPDGSGLQLLRFLRQNSPACHIIVLTTHDLPELRHYCAELGVRDYFNKATQFEEAALRLHQIALAKAGPTSSAADMDSGSDDGTTSASSGS